MFFLNLFKVMVPVEYDFMVSFKMFKLRRDCVAIKLYFFSEKMAR